MKINWSTKPEVEPGEDHAGVEVDGQRQPHVQVHVLHVLMLITRRTTVNFKHAPQAVFRIQKGFKKNFDSDPKK